MNPSDFWREQEHFRASIVAKVTEAGYGRLITKLKECQTQRSYLVCTNCDSSRVIWNHCDLKFCPLCTPRLSAKRRESIEPWTKQIRQPKHVVLTSRNSETLTRTRVRKSLAAVSRLRRTRFARDWKGGIVTTEVTNEGRGWHLHYHLLVDARFIDAKQLAVEWAKQIGQDFAIVKVKDARDRNYLAEVTKYAVKGSQIAAWSAEDIVAFIHAFRGVRTFHVFGSCFRMRAQMREFLDEVKHLRRRDCDCGCQTFRVLDSVDDAIKRGATPRQFKLRSR